MPVRYASAVWNGSLKEGAGSMKLGSGAFEGAFTFASRFEEAEGTNPEELVGAAQAGCFSMFLAAKLTDAGLYSQPDPYECESSPGGGTAHHPDRAGNRSGCPECR